MVRRRPEIQKRFEEYSMSEAIYAFHISTFEAALEDWKQEQLEAYPHKAELIETVALAMRDFMESESVHRHKMRVGRSPHQSSG